MIILIWVFWICRLSPKWQNIDCSQLISLFDHYQLQLVYPPGDHCSARNLQQETSLTTFDRLNQLQHLLRTLHRSFVCVCFSWFFTFLAIITHKISSILKWNGYTETHQFGKFFKKCMLIWQPSQYNLAKVFSVRKALLEPHYGGTVNLLASPIVVAQKNKNEKPLPPCHASLVLSTDEAQQHSGRKRQMLLEPSTIFIKQAMKGKFGAERQSFDVTLMK